MASRMRRVQCVIAPSRFMKGLAEASFGCPVVHIPNFAPDENRGAAIADPSPYLLYAGVLEPHKGLAILGEAAREYRGGKRIVLVGRGSLEGELRELARALGPRLEVRPWADQRTLASLYARAAAFVMPSTGLENAPLAAIEALSWGTPLLTTSRGGVPELLYGGTTGSGFEPNPAAIGRALRAFDERDDKADLRRNARRAYETHHTPASYLTRYGDLVGRLLSSPRDLERRSPTTGHPAHESAPEVLAPAGHNR